MPQLSHPSVNLPTERRIHVHTAAQTLLDKPRLLSSVEVSASAYDRSLQEIAMFKRIDHLEIIPKDFRRAMSFYTEVLGFRVRERVRVGQPPLDEIAYIELGGTVVEMMSVSSPGEAAADPWRAGYRMMALEVEDMDQAVEYLRSKGVEPSKGPVSLGKSKRAEIKDPDGLSIELRQW